MSAGWEATRPRHQENVDFPDGRHSEACGREVVSENPTENQRQLGPLVVSFSGAQWVVISTGAPREVLIEPLSHSVRPLSANVRPRGWLLSHNMRPLMPLLSRPVNELIEPLHVFLVVAADRRRIGLATINGNLLGYPVTANRFLQKTQCGCL